MTPDETLEATDQDSNRASDPGPGQPVGEILRRMVTGMALLVVLMALCGVLGVAFTTRTVTTMTDKIYPASAANLALLQDATDMETGIRAYGLTVSPQALDPYDAALARIPEHEAIVARYVDGDDELTALVEAQEEALATWRREFVDLRLQRTPGPEGFSLPLFERGKALFDEIRVANARTADAFDQRAEKQRVTALRRLRRVAIGVGTLAILSVFLVVRGRRRLLEDLSVPLRELEGAVHETAAGRHARVEPRGPREVRAVGLAFNDLADAQERARVVEAQIQAELTSLDSAKSDFVSNVSHELRTPLTTINGYLELVHDEFDGQLAPHHQKMLDATQRNVSRLRVLIDDLLTLSRAESRATDLQQIDILDVLSDVVSDVRLQASQRGIHIAVESQDAHVIVLADRAQVYRAFLNLVNNAVKFSEDQDDIEICLSREAGEVVVAVRDHGIGIPLQDQAQLGSRFFRASNAVSSQIPGTGLGLRIVQTIVERHMGSLRIDSEPGEGTTVTVRLPAQSDLTAPA